MQPTPLTRLVLVLLALGAALPLAAQEEKNAETWPPKRTSTALEQLVERDFVPQIALGSWVPEAHGVYGFGKLENEASVDGDTVFEIGSVTKVFTALLLAIAIENGEVTEDTKIGELVGNDLDLTPELAVITLGELASHQSGLPRLPGNHLISDPQNPYVDYDAAALAVEIATGDIDERGRYAYSNYGYGLLGYLLARQQKTTWDELIATRITKPLGMTSTAPEPLVDWQKRTAQGHNGPLRVPYWSFDALAGCGDLCSSANDLLKFLEAARKPDEKTVIGRAFKRMTRSRGKVPGGMTIGLGWHVLRREGLELVWHNGGTGGFRSFVGFDAISGRSLVILSSCDEPDITSLGLNAFDAEHPTNLLELPVSVRLPAGKVAEYEGRYRLPASLVIEFVARKGRLGAQIAGQTWMELHFREEKDAFFLLVGDAQGKFLRDDDGKIVGLEWNMAGQTSQATKLDPLPPVVQLTNEELDRFAGRYELAPEIVLDVMRNGDRLSVLLTGQSRIDVYPVSKTGFVYRAVDARLDFVIDEKGKVTALNLTQNGFTQEAPRIE